MSRALTQRQAAVLGCIRESVERRGYPPSVREIADATGARSTAQVHADLSVLVALEYVTRDGKARTITVLPPPALTVADRVAEAREDGCDHPVRCQPGACPSVRAVLTRLVALFDAGPCPDDFVERLDSVVLDARHALTLDRQANSGGC